MTGLDAFALYTGLNGLLLIALAYNVIRHRQRSKIGIGTGNDAELERACRVHGNAVEYVPVALVIIGALAMTSAPTFVVHGVGILLTVGRGLHAWGLLTSAGTTPGRFIGTLLTWISIVAGSGFLIWTAVS
ncbi:MAPEG family protein [Maricaulis sp.]|uniref:MAPEG family protein n=1 Tax=Maricaulis sp. TaxID=1486257 RepID=UPI002B279D23|nr:MAPEG family protein [Maricaulis sp.]